MVNKAKADKFGIQVDPKGEFRRLLNEAEKQVADLTIPLKEIARRWFKGNRAIYSLKGPGKYKDLSVRPMFPFWEAEGSPLRRLFSGGYKEYKEAKFGFVYPILKATGRLEKSITDPASEESIHAIIDKKILYLGSKVPYAEFLQTGTKKMPSRPYVLIGPEQVGPDEFNQRYEIFGNILRDFIAQKTAQLMKSGS